MRLDGLPQAIAWCAFATVCLAPFLFGAVERSVWIPLCQLWLGLGLASSLAAARRSSEGSRSPGSAVSRALLPVHFLFALQLVPLPAVVLGALSPGSLAAHFLPDPGDGRFRPLSVSPGATVEAWLYFAGLQGLFLALQGLPLQKRRASVYALLAVILVIAGEGLWQSRSAHPSWLYGRVPFYAPSGFEESAFGPYFNRNHFATVVAMGSGLAAGLAATLVLERGGILPLISDPVALPKVILLSGTSVFLVVTSAASGSRSGVLASVAALGMVAARGFGIRLLLITLGLGIASFVLSGASALDRLLRFDIMASRWTPWMDMATLFHFFPVFGSGIGTFGAAYWPYQTNATYEYWQHAHNEYLQWLIEGGVAGVLAVYLAMRALLRALDFRHGREIAVGGASAFATQALLDFPFRVPANAALLVCVIALTISRRKAKPDGS